MRQRRAAGRRSEAIAASAKSSRSAAKKFDIPTGGGGRKPEVNIILELKDIIFPKPGRYQFVILIDKDQKDELTLYVNQVEAPKTIKE